MEILGATDDPAEQPLPEWRRRLHRFCEVWIFALVVAFFIRHFGVELFRIPSASMEPMLYGDPGLGKGDFVLVDKLSPRFRTVHRWDVTVFQYPVPEVESSTGQRARPAISAAGRRYDDPLLHPLLGSNFVKRAVCLPGERFYISGGDVFVDQGGSFAIARKPAELQSHLWLPIYQAGVQDGYLPWTGAGGATVAARGDALELVLGEGQGGEVAFTQPFRNLYLKPGPSVAIKPKGIGGEWSVVADVTMTHPQFTLGKATGTLWELDRWSLKRLTSADQDDPSRVHQTENELMDEWVGDVQARFTLSALAGEVRLRLANRTLDSADPTRRIDLILDADAWRVEGGGSAGQLAAKGSGGVGHAFAFAQVDAQVVLQVDGHEVLRQDVPWVDPNHDRLGLSWLGHGTATIGGLAMGRDLHYTAKGFLAQNPAGQYDLVDYADRIQANPGIASEDIDRGVDVQRLARSVRAGILGKQADELTRDEAKAAYGTGPDHPARVPDHAYLMMGDNSPHSFDGREWGFVPEENLRGRAWLVVFPPQRWRVIR